MNYAQQIMEIVQRRANNTARQQKALEVGKILSVNSDGTLDVEIPGSGVRSVPRSSGRVSVQVGQQVTISRVSGQANSSFASGRSPYLTAEEEVIVSDQAH